MRHSGDGGQRVLSSVTSYLPSQLPPGAGRRATMFWRRDLVESYAVLASNGRENDCGTTHRIGTGRQGATEATSKSRFNVPPLLGNHRQVARGCRGRRRQAESGVSAAGRIAAVETGAAAVMSRKSWAVVDVDRQKTVLVTQWRWYATWWAAWLRIYDGADLKIARAGETPWPPGPRSRRE